MNSTVLIHRLTVENNALKAENEKLKGWLERIRKEARPSRSANNQDYGTINRIGEFANNALTSTK